jgi:hypothetical protein
MRLCLSEEVLIEKPITPALNGAQCGRIAISGGKNVSGLCGRVADIFSRAAALPHFAQQPAAPRRKSNAGIPAQTRTDVRSGGAQTG